MSDKNKPIYLSKDIRNQGFDLKQIAKALESVLGKNQIKRSGYEISSDNVSQLSDSSISEKQDDTLKLQPGGMVPEHDKNTNKVSENYINNFPNTVKWLLDSPERNPSISQKVNNTRRGNEIINRFKNFNLNDSTVYTPLLNRLERYIGNTYENKDDFNDTGIKNINHTKNRMYILARHETMPYDNNHAFVNKVLSELSDEEIDKLLNVQFYGKNASLKEALKAKPKSLSWGELLKLHRIMNKTYFNGNLYRKSHEQLEK